MRIIGNDPNTPRQTQVVASGTLSTGDTVVVNSDGTVSAVVSSGETESVGSLTKLGDSQNYPAAVYDSNSQKIVYLYLEYFYPNPHVLKAVVGTISGTTISFGTPSSVSDNPNWLSACFDSTSNKIIVAYADGSNSGKGTAVVGNVSGSSISFGTPVVFEQGLILYTSCVHDTNANKTVITYKDQTNSNYGTAVVGTVSGTSISFGTPVVFRSQEANFTTVDYDPVAQKVGVFYKSYRDVTFEDTGEAVVGTVSGSSISFGTHTEFSDISANWITSGYDASAGSFVALYRAYSGGYLTNVIAGQISGTSFTMGSPVTVGTDNSQSLNDYLYDSTAQKSVFLYGQGDPYERPYVLSVKVNGTTVTADTPLQLSTTVNKRAANGVHDPVSGKNALFVTDTDDSESGNYYVYTTGYTSTNLTAENYIGTAKSGAADGDGVVVNTQGTVDDNQTGLTAGQSYYVQTDGTLSTTAGDPSVFAGTAVSATKLIVKG